MTVPPKTKPDPVPLQNAARSKQTCVIEYVWREAEHYTVGRGGASIASIILHATEGHEAGDLETLIGGGGRSVSVHWYVTRTGKVYHMVDDANTANHAGVVIARAYSNSQSVGIETEHVNTQDYPPVQVQTVANLCAFLRQKHGRGLAIKSHAQVASPPGRKTDPAQFPWDEFSHMVSTAMFTTWSAVQVPA